MKLPKVGEKWMVSKNRYRGRSKGDVAVVLEVGYGTLESLTKEYPMVWWAWDDTINWAGWRDWLRNDLHDSEKVDTIREDFMRNFEPYDPAAEPHTDVDVLKAENAKLRRIADERLVNNHNLNALNKKLSDEIDRRKKINAHKNSRISALESECCSVYIHNLRRLICQ